MAKAIVVSLERDLPDPAAAVAYAKAKGGKALARESDRLDIAAPSRDVSSVASLLSESPAALRAQMEAGGFDPSKMRLPPELWFSAVDGLKTVRALTEFVTANFKD